MSSTIERVKYDGKGRLKKHSVQKYADSQDGKPAGVYEVSAENSGVKVSYQGQDESFQGYISENEEIYTHHDENGEYTISVCNENINLDTPNKISAGDFKEKLLADRQKMEGIIKDVTGYSSVEEYHEQKFPIIHQKLAENTR